MRTRDVRGRVRRPAPVRSAQTGADGPTERWSEGQALEYLRSLEQFGMRFGLHRMRALMAELGAPQRRFQSIQVLGTNGKSSTARMTAAILERCGLRTATYTSPHLISYR